MKNHLIKDKIMWSVFLILPGIVHADYLKSMGNIKVLEGETCYLYWEAYTKQQRLPPCHWWYAHDEVEETLIFLAYDGSRRLEFGDHAQWRFTNIEEPCSGGLHKKAKLEDAGVYCMQTSNGILQKKDSVITVEVLKGTDLTFSVYINGKVSNFDLNAERTWTLDLLETHSLINVSVVLSKTFPSTTVIRISDGEEESCDDPYKKCYKITDLSETTKRSILIKIETEIIGATEIIITQPLHYSAPADNRSRNVFAGLFFVLLTFIIIFMIILVIFICNRNKRTAYKQAGIEDEVKTGEKLSMKQHMKNIKSDIIATFQVNNQFGEDELSEIFKRQESYRVTLEKELDKDEKRLNSEITQCNDVFSSTDDLLGKCQKMLEKMEATKAEMDKNSAGLNQEQHEQHEITKLLIKLVKEKQTWLKCIKNRFETIKNLNLGSKNSETELAEEATEETGMMNKSLKDVLEQHQKIVDLNHKQVKLKEMLKEIEMMKDFAQTKNDAEKEINDINEHFEKLQKGWEHSQCGDSVDPDSSTKEKQDPSKGKDDKSSKKKKK